MKTIKRSLFLVIGVLFLLSAMIFVVACKSKTVKITFETNNGTAIAAIEAEAGEDISSKLPKDPVKEGFTFSGWYLDSGLKEKTSLPTVMPENDTTYYAGWDENLATLTLSAGNGGTLSQTSYEVRVGTDLAAFLADKAPTAESELEFAGWFENNAALDATRKMPAEGLTLTAKYNATYTVNLYKMDVNGEYPSTPEVTTGKAFYGEEFTYTVQEEHFSADNSHEGSKYSVAELKKDETFNVYLERESFGIFYNANYPDGLIPENETEYVKYYYGTEDTIADASFFGECEEIRFAGWATSKTDSISLFPGDKVEMSEENIFLYAVWEIGVTDIFGGSDRIFVSVTEQNTVYLHRTAYDEIKGTYDAATGIFTVQPGNVELNGKISGESLFYYKDALEKVYAAENGGSDTLELKALGEAVYTTADGSAITGRYEVDMESGDFYFEGNGTKFFFSLIGSGKSVTFRMGGNERGYYGLSTGVAGGALLFFDGMGGLKMLFGGNNAYVDGLGNRYTSLNGTYEYYEDADCYYVTITMGADGSASVHMRLTEGEIDHKDYHLKGTYTLSDGYTGWYYENRLTSPTKDLFVDGFGRAAYLGEEGSYTVRELRWYSYLEFLGGPTETNHDYIVFQPDNGSEEVLIRLYNGEDFEYDVLLDHPVVYNYTNALVLNGVVYEGAFIYVLNDGGTYDAELWVPSSYGEGIYESVCVGSITETDDADTYYFEGSFFGVDYSHYVKITTDGNGVSTATFFVKELVFIAGKLVINNEGCAMYTPDGGTAHEVGFEMISVSAGITERTGISAVYIFEYDGFIHTFTINTQGGVAKLADTAFLDMGYIASNTYGARMVLLEGGKAILAAHVGDGVYTFYLYGSVTDQGDGVKIWEYEHNDYPYDDRTEFLEQFGKFQFQIDEGSNGYVYLIYDGQPLDVTSAIGRFIADGYGRATLTIGQDVIEGLYDYIENLIVFYTTDGYEWYIKLRADKNDFIIIDLEEHFEAGYYYGVSDGMLDPSYAFFFDGDGVAKYIDPSETRTGTYKFLGVRELDGIEFDEYEIDFGDEKMNIVVAVATAGGQPVGVFFTRDEAAVINVTVAGGGNIVSDGYNSGIYTDKDGVERIGYATYADIIENDFVNHGYLANKDAANVVFVEIDESYTIVAEYLFDVKDGVATLRPMISGLFIRNNGGRQYSDYLWLDGYGNAEIRSANGSYYNVNEKGTYQAVPELGANIYRYESEDKQNIFIFDIRVVYDFYNYGFAYYYDFRVYTAEENGTFYGEDGSVAVLDGFGAGTYIDRYGMAYSGNYAEAYTDGLIRFNIANSADKVFFYLDAANGTFRLITGDFIAVDGVLFAYLGADTEISIPDDVKRITAGAIPNTVASIDFNQVEIIDETAFRYNYSLTQVSSEHILEVGNYAFESCSKLETVYLPNAKSIGDGAFAGNYALIRVTLGAVEKMGANVFSRSNYMPIFTLDLTAVPDLTAITIDPATFDKNQYAGVFGAHLMYQRILVKDLAAVNALLTSDKWPDIAKEFVTFASEDTTMNGAYYYGSASETIYRFDSGAVIKDIPMADGVIRSSVVALYAVDAQGGVTLYEYSNGSFSTTGKKMADLSMHVFEGETFYRSGVEYTRSTNEGKTLKFTINVILSDQNHFSLWKDIYSYSGSATYGDKTSSTVSFNLADHDFTFVVDATQEAYYVSNIGETNCDIELQGRIEVLDAECADIKGWNYRFTLVIKDNKIVAVREIISLYTWGGTGTEQFTGYVAHEDGTLTVYIGYGATSTEHYRLIYTPASADAEASLTMRIEGVTEEFNKDSVCIALDVDTKGNIVRCTGVRYQTPSWTYISWTLNDQTLNEDGSITVKATDTDGVQHTYKVKIDNVNGTAPNATYDVTIEEITD